jgi:hypothetical protein
MLEDFGISWDEMLMRVEKVQPASAPLSPA